MHKVIDNDVVAIALRERGYARINHFVDASMVLALTAETDALLLQGGAGVQRMESHPSGPALRLQRSELDPTVAPALRELFSSPQMRRVTEATLGPCESICEDIVVTNDVYDVPIADVHFDLRRACKFFLYLTDADEESGAFCYAEGSHRMNAAYRAGWLAAGRRHRDLPNVAAPGEVQCMEILGGPAGTLLIFDTEGWHTASPVRPGRRRRVVRAACPQARQEVTHPALFSRQRLVESRLNPMRLFRKVDIPAGRGCTGGTGRRN